MFKINYQITYKPNELQNLSQEELDRCFIEGNIEIEVNDKKYGYCKREPLAPEETGWDLLTEWFEGLVDVLIKLKQEHKYIALSDIESYNTWIEFKKINTREISISVIESTTKVGTSQVITEPPPNGKPSDWANEIITYDELRNEILLKLNQYLSELNAINPELVKGKTIAQLKKLADSV